MKKLYKLLIFNSIVLIITLSSTRIVRAQDNRFFLLESQLKEQAINNKGLREKTKFSVSGASIGEFLRGMAQAHNLDINVDPVLTMRVTNNFRNELVYNVLLFLAKEYKLDIQFTGSIISVFPYQPPYQPAVPVIHKALQISFNKSTGYLSYDLAGDTLGEVTKKITQLSGQNLIIAPEVAGKTVTAFAQELPVIKAVEKLAFAGHLKVTTGTDGALVLEALGDDEQLVPRKDPQAQSQFILRRNGKNSGASTPLSFDVSTTAGQKMVRVDAVNTPIADLIHSVAQEAGINYFIFSELKGNVTASLTGISFNSFLTMIFQATPYTYKIEKGVYMIGERGLEGLRDHQIVQLQNRSIDSVQTFIPQEMKHGVEIKEFKELNSFLLTGSGPQVAEVVSFLKSIDKPVPMVTIEVIIMDIRKSKSVATGISAGKADSVKTGGTLFPGLNYTFGSKNITEFLTKLGANNIINLGKVTPNFYVKLSALEANDNVDIRQTPKLTTLNGHVASLSIGNTRYYTTTTQNVLGSISTSTVVTQQFTPIDANLSIDIKPVVSGDEQVTLNIDVKISDFTDIPLTGPPPTSNSKFRSIIRIRNQEMVVLGGLERTEADDSGSGVPLLARIPILKWLFSSRTKGTSKTVSIIFIKPTIQY